MPQAASAALLADLDHLLAGGGARDEESLHRFRGIVAALRSLPDATSDFRVQLASAEAWAALLFSSWRHRKYDRPDVAGAERVRAFIRRDLGRAGACAERATRVPLE
jgi:hypothetical protein